MWTYRQSSGELSHDGAVVGYGWSGYEDGINVPGMQDIPCIGPIPRGVWGIVGPPQDTDTHGPYVLKLMPHVDTQTCGRAGFLIHGHNAKRPFDNSQGCLIFDRDLRVQIWQSGDHELEVVG